MHSGGRPPPSGHVSRTAWFCGACYSVSAASICQSWLMRNQDVLELAPHAEAKRPRQTTSSWLPAMTGCWFESAPAAPEDWNRSRRGAMW